MKKIKNEGCIKVSLVNEFFESVKAKDAIKVKELLGRDANLVHSKTENGDTASKEHHHVVDFLQKYSKNN
jgi:hypothetical protein